VHNAAVKPAAQAAIKRIREYNGDAKIMSHQSKLLLQQLKF
jgi:hypothetical protein